MQQFFTQIPKFDSIPKFEPQRYQNLNHRSTKICTLLLVKKYREIKNTRFRLFFTLFSIRFDLVGALRFFGNQPLYNTKNLGGGTTYFKGGGV
jgi:hypothetical protein